MDLTNYRSGASEQARMGDLMRLTGDGGESALDIGARDGYLSKLLADRFVRVTALDLQEPHIDDPRVTCVAGDITGLEFADRSFDLVFCAEVLEHIPPHLLAKACSELARVSKKHVLIGVPYRQDTRLWRTTCSNCGKTNPPWGHVNQFDEHKLARLFQGLAVTEASFVGTNSSATNAMSSWLMNIAGNPYGTYDQEEPCVHCDANLQPPRERQFFQKVATKLAFAGMQIQKPFVASHGNWIHMLFTRQPA